MATIDSPFDRGTFGLLPEPKGRGRSFALSTLLNASTAAVVLLLSLAQVHEVRQHQTVTQLVFPTPVPKPVPPPVPQVKLLPPPPVVRDAMPKIAMPKPLTPPPPKPVEIKMPDPVLPKVEVAPPRRVAPPPQPKVGLFKSESPTLVANNMSRPTPKAGGFGDPQGVKPDPNANRPGTIAAVGSFSGAPGIGPAGAGRARPGSVHGTEFGSGVEHGVPGGHDKGTIASSGFGSGVLGGTGRPGSHGTVARASFNNDEFGSGPARPAQPVEPVATPIVVISKPLPAYTAEARELKIQGDVTLRVRFTAAGQIEVLGVVNGLGHGLDQEAVKAAEQIRFKPATRDGHPVDQVSLVRITFQMA
ncbi:MAG: energy transducer TonB [Acidobacteriaceae bacterium]